MASSLFHFPTSHKLFFSPPPSIYIADNHHCCSFICCSKPAICASIKKQRASRKVKSNDDLRNDIREFLSSVELPEDHVPTMKELSHHGRQDLANIVRRRGYKLVKELLVTSKRSTYECSGEDGRIEKSGDESLDGKIIDTVDDDSLPSEASAKNDVILNFDEQNSGDQQPLDYSSLEEKVANFIENGELDSIDDSGFEIFQRGEQVEGSVEGQNIVEIKSTCNSDDAVIFNGKSTPQSTRHVEHRRRQSSPTGTDSLSNADTEPHDMEIQAEINHLKFVLHQKEMELIHLKEQIEEEKRLLSIMQAKVESEIREAQRLISEKDAELSAAEDSLSGLKEVEIEYWADAESVEVSGSFNGWHQKIKMDLEESSDLIGEDIQASSDCIDPVGMRKPRLWKTVLWLYPGIYEGMLFNDGINAFLLLSGKTIASSGRKVLPVLKFIHERSCSPWAMLAFHIVAKSINRAIQLEDFMCFVYLFASRPIEYQGQYRLLGELSNFFV